MGLALWLAGLVLFVLGVAVAGSMPALGAALGIGGFALLGAYWVKEHPRASLGQHFWSSDGGGDPRRNAHMDTLGDFTGGDGGGGDGGGGGGGGS